MIDNKPEVTEQPKPEVVQLGQKFQLFKSRDLVYGNIFSSTNVPSVPIVILEDRQTFGSIPIRLYLWTGVPLQVVPILTPLNPDIQYTVTEEDLDPIKRHEKIKKSRFRNIEKEDLFTFQIGSTENFKPQENILEELRRIRLQLFFPELTYESSASNSHLDEYDDEKGLYFKSFYPLDFGPLPVPPSHLIGSAHITRGYGLALPRDFEKLSQIQARFVLAPEQNRGGEN